MSILIAKDSTFTYAATFKTSNLSWYEFKYYKKSFDEFYKSKIL
jgi:hypothetical protein